MEKDLISIIVPIYNEEKYIKKCVSTIISQEYSNWELLLINDGSTDGTYSIIETLSKIDPRIKVINQENCGAIKTRIKGILLAKGEYITFVDADDFLNENYLIDLISGTKNNKVDLVIYGSFQNVSKRGFLQDTIIKK